LERTYRSVAVSPVERQCTMGIFFLKSKTMRR
jgi:hypothetical protein